MSKPKKERVLKMRMAISGGIAIGNGKELPSLFLHMINDALEKELKCCYHDKVPRIINPKGKILVTIEIPALYKS